jgi:hypothetical protein
MYFWWGLAQGINCVPEAGKLVPQQPSTLHIPFDKK